MTGTEYAHRVELDLSFEESIEQTVHVLGEYGYSVITWIDLRDKLIERLGADFRPYVIMGLFDPNLVQRALELTLDIGLVLPFNVIVYESEPGHTVVAALKPEVAFSALGDDPEVGKLAQNASERLHQVVQTLEP